MRQGGTKQATLPSAPILGNSTWAVMILRDRAVDSRSPTWCPLMHDYNRPFPTSAWGRSQGVTTREIAAAGQVVIGS